MAIKDTKEKSNKRRPTATIVLPPLEPGDRLTRNEFERRYHAMPRVKKAELVEGVVFMPTPVHFEGHAEPHSHIMTWLGIYCATTPGVKLGDNATVEKVVIRWPSGTEQTVVGPEVDRVHKVKEPT